MGILDKLAGVLGGAFGLVDDLHTSTEEKLQLKNALLSVQVGVVEKVVEAEMKTIEARAKIVEAEAKSSNFLTSSWRPITMLTFLAIIVLTSFGWVDTESLQQVPERMWSLLTLGIGGYIGGRTIEKTVPSVLSSLKSAEKV